MTRPALSTPQALVTAVLGLSVLALGTAIGLETDWGTAVGRAVTVEKVPAGAVKEARLLPPFKLPEVATAYREMADRPAFTPTRRPAPPPVPVATAPSMPRGKYTLTGAIVAGDVRAAYLREVATGKSLTVKQGDLLAGVRVDLVEPRRVVLRMGEETETLDLVSASSGGARPPGAAAAPPPVAAAAIPTSPYQQTLGGPAVAPKPAIAHPGNPPAPGAPGAPVANAPLPVPQAPVGTPAVAMPPGIPGVSQPVVTPTQTPPPADGTSRRRAWQNAQ
jgi:hypothetical protein